MKLAFWEGKNSTRQQINEARRPVSEKASVVERGSDAHIKESRGFKDYFYYDVKRWIPQMEGEAQVLGEKHTQQPEMIKLERKDTP